ncbi:conserved hypothetical protein [Gammaproteobacteria bacterium]
MTPSLLNSAITTQDLWNLICKLSHDEQIHLAKLALRAAALSNIASDDVTAYMAMPVTYDEFSTDEDMLAWESDGWEEFDASW